MDKKIFNMLMWVSGVNYIQDNFGQILLDEKPQFSFVYDSIRYLFTEQVYKVTEDSDDIPLTAQQQDEINNFIQEKRQEVGILKLAVDSEGGFLGLVKETDPRIFKIVDISPSTQDDWVWCFNQNKWVIAYHYDADGTYVRASSGNAVGFTKIPFPFALAPLPHKFDELKNAWALDDSKNELIDFIRNKVIIDTINLYIQQCVSISEIPEIQHGMLVQFAQNISTNIANINLTQDKLDELEAITTKLDNFVTRISEKSNILDVYLSGVEFTSINTKSTPIYTASENVIMELVADTTLVTSSEPEDTETVADNTAEASSEEVIVETVDNDNLANNA